MKDPFCAGEIAMQPPQQTTPAQVRTVIFVDNCGVFRGGELATFLLADASALVGAGLAKLV